MKNVYIVVLQIILGLPAYEEIGIFDGFGFFNFQNSEDIGYDIGSLVNQLNLQFCSIVEVGEGFCSMFVEFRSNLKSTAVNSDNVAEVYLGLCPCSMLKLWRFCGDHLNSFRPDDCKFSEDIKNTNARVHRRLCDITSMLHWNPSCNCSQDFAGQSLKPVTGFKTCYKPPLPDSICSPRSVCGVSECNTKTLYQVHMVKCDSNCKGKQPFCEENSFSTTKFRTVHSVWTPWSNNFCNDTTKYLESESVCVDSNLNPAFDCLGPGIYCCPVTYPECRCFTTIVNNVLKVRRILTPCGSNSTYYSNSMEGIADEIMYDIDLVTTNNSNIIREIYKKKRSVNLNDYDSQWDIPNVYSFSKISKIDRLEKSTVTQKQVNWEELNPKYSDPWNKTLITPSAKNYNNPCTTYNSFSTCKHDLSKKNFNFTNWMNNYINVYSHANHNVSVKESSNKVHTTQSQNKKNTSKEVIIPVKSMMKSINRLNTSFIKPQIIQKKNNNPNIYQRIVTHHMSYNKYTVNSMLTNHNIEINDTLKSGISGNIMKLNNDKIEQDMKNNFPAEYKNIIDLILNNLTNHNNIVTEEIPIKNTNTILAPINTFNEINSTLANVESYSSNSISNRKINSNYSSNSISNRKINSNVAVIDIDPEKEIYKEIEISTSSSDEIINNKSTSYPHSYYDFIHNYMLKKI